MQTGQQANLVWKALRRGQITDKARAAVPELAQLAALENAVGTASKLKSYTPAETLLVDEGTLLVEIWAEGRLRLAATPGLPHLWSQAVEFGPRPAEVFRGLVRIRDDVVHLHGTGARVEEAFDLRPQVRHSDR